MTTPNRIPLIGLLLVQLVIGYEWAMSGLTKVARGGFPQGLAAELREKSEGAASWYKSFLDSVVIPNAGGWGYAIESGELLVGVALIGTALLWLLSWDRLQPRGRRLLLLLIAGAALAGSLMNVSFHLANGSAHPWLIPAGGFDEGVDVDSLMPLIQLTLAGVSLAVWRALGREEVARHGFTAPQDLTSAPATSRGPKTQRKKV